MDNVDALTDYTWAMLKALEEGDLDNLPAKTFLRGFVQSYASQLKMDIDAILELFHDEMGSTLVNPTPAPGEDVETVEARPQTVVFKRSVVYSILT